MYTEASGATWDISVEQSSIDAVLDQEHTSAKAAAQRVGLDMCWAVLGKQEQFQGRGTAPDPLSHERLDQDVLQGPFQPGLLSGPVYWC